MIARRPTPSNAARRGLQVLAAIVALCTGLGSSSWDGSWERAWPAVTVGVSQAKAKTRARRRPSKRKPSRRKPSKRKPSRRKPSKPKARKPGKKARHKARRKPRRKAARRLTFKPRHSKRYHARMAKRCKRKRKSRACKAWRKERKEDNKRRAQVTLARRCRSRKMRNTRTCKRLARTLRRQRKARAICGVRRGRARRHDTVARMARRYHISAATFRRYNKLSPRARHVRRRRWYVIYQSPFHNMRLHNGVLLERVDGVLGMQRPQRGWGKPILVDSLRTAAIAVQRAYPQRPWLIMGDLSKEGGGCLPPHKSHRGGFDADVGYYYMGGKQRGWLDRASPRELDADRTWAYLSALLKTGALQFAFIDYDLQPPLYAAALRSGETVSSLRSVFQYPRPKGQTKASVIRHLSGHHDHVHLRMRCLNAACDLPATLATKIVQAVGARRGGPRREGRPMHHRRRRRALAARQLY